MRQETQLTWAQGCDSGGEQLLPDPEAGLVLVEDKVKPGRTFLEFHREWKLTE